MKICYIFEGAFFLKKASAIQVAKMCQAFLEEGHEITLVVQEPLNDCSGIEGVWNLYGIRRPFKLCIVKRNKCFPLTAVIKAIQIESQMVFTRNLYVAALASMKGFPTILELHDFVKLRRHTATLYFLCKLKLSPKFAVISKALMDDLFMSYPWIFNEDNTFMEPDGVDFKLFQSVENEDRRVLKDMLGIEDVRQFVAGYAGSLYRGKGYEIIRELAERMPDVLFLIAGGPDETVRFEKARVCEHGIENIKFIGYISGNMIPCFLSICDALLLPNQKNVQPSGGSGDIGKYTSPLKLFEYMAIGRPILASNLPILCEVLNDQNAILVSANESIAWEKGLRRIMAGGDIVENICRKARLDAAKYDWRLRVRNILDKISTF